MSHGLSVGISNRQIGAGVRGAHARPRERPTRAKLDVLAKDLGLKKGSRGFLQGHSTRCEVVRIIPNGLVLKYVDGQILKGPYHPNMFTMN